MIDLMLTKHVCLVNNYYLEVRCIIACFDVMD